MSKFRGKLLDSMDRAVENGKLKLPEGMSLQRWKNLKNKLGRVKWNVNIRKRYEHGNGVLSYLARYVRGGPISNSRIISCEDGKVVFRYRVNGEGSKSRKTETMTLAADQFIRRYLLHIPEPRTKVVRYYGLYNPCKEQELQRCMECFDQDLPEDIEFLDWQTYCEGRGDEHPERCPICGRTLICLSATPPVKNIPPPEETFLKEAA